MKSVISTRGQFGKVSMGLIGVVGLIVIFVAVFGSYMSAVNRGNKYESLVEKHWNSGKVTLSQCTTTIRNISKIPAQYQQQLESVLRAEMEGRYGGINAERVAKFVQERGMTFDSSMLTKVQNTIVSCEKNYADDQKVVLETLSEYEIARGSAWGGIFLSMAGYPKKDLSKFKMILDESTQTQYTTGTREDYDLNEKDKK